MGKFSDAFKKEFQKRMQEMTDFVNKAPDQEIEKVKIDILKTKSLSHRDILCKDEDDFLDKTSLCIAGQIKPRAYILQHPDVMSPQEIEGHRKAAKKANRPFNLPSIIHPINARDPERTFTSYILFYTHDEKLFMLPYIGEFFSDSEPHKETGDYVK